MRDGKRLDFGGHFIYQSGAKKEKPADCVFLDTNRICNNRKSDVYLAKCFRASWCPLRRRGADPPINDNPTQRTEPIDDISTFTIGMKVQNEKGEIGTIHSVKSNVITVEYRTRNVCYLYPDCIEKQMLKKLTAVPSYYP